MNALEFYRSKRWDLLQLQLDEGFPAIWVASQFLHESTDPETGHLTTLASLHNNHGGLKFAGWQRQFGCYPVEFGTWEEVEGEIVDTDAVFCGCDSWETWLKVYAYLIRMVYPDAVGVSDPLQFGRVLKDGGYATDSNYLAKVYYKFGKFEDILQTVAWKQDYVKAMTLFPLPDGTPLLHKERPAEKPVEWWELAVIAIRLASLREGAPVRFVADAEEV